ncbi:MAG: DUF4153 domain-containing protein [Flavobacteriales bacterium]
MAFPSLDAIVRQASQTFSRFPLSILSAVLGTVLGISLVESSSNYEHSLSKMLLTTMLGLPLFLALTLFSEAKKHSSSVKLTVQLMGVVFVLIYFFTLEKEFTEVTAGRFFLINLALHMAVAISAFTQKGRLNAFWQFNKTLFLQFLIAVLYSVVIFAGLATAMAISDVLFSLDFNEKYYLRLWFIVSGIFNTWMFLSGIPEEFDRLDNDHDYPKGLKIFTQFILLPLVGIYLLILYLYLVKIIFTFSLPKGLVSWLVNIFSVMGILSFLLIYPLREQEDNKWISIFNKRFFFALFPLIGLLVVAIGVRIANYGITENRYFVLAIAVWLTFIALYYLIKGFHQIKLIPVSLFVVSIFSAIGPLSAFNVSIYSQEQRLMKNLEKTGMLRDGAIYPADTSLARDQEELMHEVYEGIQYLAKKNAADNIIRLLAEPIDDALLADEADSRSRKIYMISSALITHLKLEPYAYYSYFAEAAIEEQYIFHQLSVKPFAPVDVRDASSLLDIGGYESDSLFRRLKWVSDTTTYFQLNKAMLLPAIKLQLAKLVMRERALNDEYQIMIAPDELFFETPDLINVVGVQFNSATVTITSSDTSFQNFRCWVLLK